LRRGAAAAITVLFLPVLAGALIAMASLGRVVWLHHVAYQAADLGALAGVQELDLERLAVGVVRLLPDEARSEAERYSRANLVAAIGAQDIEDLAIEVRVINPDSSGSLDPETGRALEHPTVCVVIRFGCLFRAGAFRWEQTIRAHADASVVPR
jgi:hypothetical protein